MLQVLALPPSELLPHVTPLLLSDNDEAVIEAARVYGNFSRSPDVRAYMQRARVVEALVLLLDHGSSEVLYSVCGTLINFTMDPDPARKGVLAGLGGVSRLVEVLGRTLSLGELTDTEVGVVEVVCKALFNVAADDNNAAAAAAAATGGGGGSSSSFSAEEAAEVLAMIGMVDGSALAEVEGMPALLARLAAQLGRLAARLRSAELEALPAAAAAAPAGAAAGGER